VGSARKKLALLAVVAGAAVLAAVLASVVRAGVSGISPSLKVTSAEKTGACTSGSQPYTVHTIVTVANGSTSGATVEKAGWSVKGNSPSGAFTSAATVASDGGLTGATVAAHTTTTYRSDIATTVPCDTTSAQVCVTLTVSKGSTTGTTDVKCADFIKEGKTVVPAGTIGLLGLTLLLGGGLAVVQVLSRRRRGGHDRPALK
jgi:hypothetical protein